MSLIMDILEANLNIILIFTIAILLVILFAKYSSSHDKRLPPGPFSLPILGTLPFLGRDIREPLRKLSEKYGDVFTVYFGTQRTIILNSFKVVKEAFVEKGNANLLAGRPKDVFFIQAIQQGKGVISNQGSSWRKNRKVAHKILREAGVGSTYMEERIQKEAFYLIDALTKHQEAPLNPAEFIMPAVANVIYSVCYEHRREYDDPEFIKYLDDLAWCFELLSNCGILTLFPILKHLPGDFTGYKQMMNIANNASKRYMLIIQEHIDTYKEGVTRDFVDAYLKAMYQEQAEEHNEENPPELSLLQLEKMLGDLFGAGTDTTANTLGWGLVYLLHNPDIQEKVKEEIDRVIGKSTPSMSYKSQMPYTEAYILETHRMATVVPLGVPHSTVEDVEISGYIIPKDTMVMSNLYSVHFDEKIWPDPWKFDPTRFLDPDGKIHKLEKLIPFSMGKRVCLGESLARMEAFLMFVNILQNFTVTLPEGATLPPLMGKLGMTHIPQPHKVKLIPRNRKSEISMCV